MSQAAMNKLVAALKHGAGLRDDFIYYMSFDDYKNFPDPFPRTTFTVKEVQSSISRYPNPQRPTSCFAGISTVGCLHQQRDRFRTRWW
jgi:hypothetical protein